MKQSNTKKLYILAIVALVAAVIIAVCTFALRGNDKTASESEPETTVAEEVVEDEEEAEEEETESISEIEKMIVGRKLEDLGVKFGTLGECSLYLEFSRGNVVYSYSNIGEDFSTVTKYSLSGETVSFHVDENLSVGSSEKDYTLSFLNNSSIIVAECKNTYNEDGKEKTEEYKTYFAPEFEEKWGDGSIFKEISDKTWISKNSDSDNSIDAEMKISVKEDEYGKHFTGKARINNESSDLSGDACGNNIGTFYCGDKDFILESYKGNVNAYFYDMNDGTFTKVALEEKK